MAGHCETRRRRRSLACLLTGFALLVAVAFPVASAGHDDPATGSPAGARISGVASGVAVAATRPDARSAAGRHIFTHVGYGGSLAVAGLLFVLPRPYGVTWTYRQAASTAPPGGIGFSWNGRAPPGR